MNETTIAGSTDTVQSTTECVVVDTISPETFRAQAVEIGSCAMVAVFTLLCLGVVLWR